MRQGGGAAVGNNLEQLYLLDLDTKRCTCLRARSWKINYYYFQLICFWLSFKPVLDRFLHWSHTNSKSFTKQTWIINTAGEDRGSCWCTRRRWEDTEDWHFIIPSLPSGQDKWSGQMCTAGRATWATLNVNLWSQCIFNPRFENINRFYYYIILYLHEEISPSFMNERMTDRNIIKGPAGLHSKDFWMGIYCILRSFVTLHCPYSCITELLKYRTWNKDIRHLTRVFRGNKISDLFAEIIH